MKKETIALLVCLVLAACGRKSMDEQFAEDARQETQQMCPRMIDQSTRLDSIVYDIETRTEQYFYTFLGDLDDSSIFTDKFVEDLRESMMKSLRNEIKLKKMTDEGVNFSYLYRSCSTGDTLMHLLFSKQDYTGPMHLRTFNKRIADKWEDYTEKHCPEVQDECTTLDNVAFDSLTQTLIYDFSMKGELDIPDFHEVYPDAKKELKGLLTEGIKENTMLKDERKEGLKFKVRYTSESSKKILLDIDIEL